MSLTDMAARRRRELALAEIERRYEGVKARLYAQRDLVHRAELDAVWAVYEAVAADLASSSLVKRSAAVDAIWRRLATAHERLWLSQEDAESAWLDARVNRALERRSFNFDLSEVAA